MSKKVDEETGLYACGDMELQYKHNCVISEGNKRILVPRAMHCPDRARER